MGRQRRIAKEYLSHNLDEHCLEDTRLAWSLSYPSGGGTILWELRFLVDRKFDCEDRLARRDMLAHQHCELFNPPAGDLIGSTLN